MAKIKKTFKRRLIRNVAPKSCYFCAEIKEPHLSDIPVLKKFLTERGKIVPRSRNGLCARHQRLLSLNIKYARHLALLSFVVKAR